MKKNILKITCLAIATMFSSCSDYLDVVPEDKILETKIYSTESGINNVLNGIYLDLFDEDAYGGNLTMTTVESLAQRYSFPDNRSDDYVLVNYSYGEEYARETFDAMWSSMYSIILNLNDLIANVDKYQALPEYKINIIKGEAYGLRAMLHFDLLRLFGPIYSTNPDDASIPYYTEAKAENGKILPATEVMNAIIADLKQAEALLVNDAIRPEAEISNPEFFYIEERGLRFNFYAVKALQARAYLYAGNTLEANAAAKVVIDEASTVFSWTNPTDVISAGGNPDRTFSSEVVFALHNIQLYERHNDYFSSSLSNLEIYAPNSTRLVNVFESNENDYRYNSTWILPTTGGKSYKTFFKYADVDDARKSFRFRQPLIRISEMYYIVAETESDAAEGLQYLNTVRYNRGLVDLPAGTNMDAELRKEYQKEFFGEGQLFYYYKRKNINRIPNGSSSSRWSNKTMGPEQYVLPLPESETKYQ
ncbi:RagB/SusD family nutrient uptake outer membrane protein [Gaetbulibacter saemankumensis]|uniref:RagB/SusD family nutrient uptake outer membrane protein n=1 Tax=Gaetbulibacter saemankumensis TaxID=311208 RepID=UPI000400C0DB|nr:RagB/SusD family nutrient uptake outer membrane protein [Gaetbulibacter saemankumensis]